MISDTEQARRGQSSLSYLIPVSTLSITRSHTLLTSPGRNLLSSAGSTRYVFSSFLGGAFSDFRLPMSVMNLVESPTENMLERRLARESVSGLESTLRLGGGEETVAKDTVLGFRVMSTSAWMILLRLCDGQFTFICKQKCSRFIHFQGSAAKQTIEPMLVKSWANVADGGPALKQHSFNFSCLLTQQTRSGNPILF